MAMSVIWVGVFFLLCAEMILCFLLMVGKANCLRNESVPCVRISVTETICVVKG